MGNCYIDVEVLSANIGNCYPVKFEWNLTGYLKKYWVIKIKIASLIFINYIIVVLCYTAIPLTNSKLLKANAEYNPFLYSFQHSDYCVSEQETQGMIIGWIINEWMMSNRNNLALLIF